MADVTIIGSGKAARSCADVLVRAGFRLHHAFEVDHRDRTPVVLGEVNGVLGIARDLVQAGRHVLISEPESFPSERLDALLSERKKGQALFFWNKRRFHPGYRFVRGLIEADTAWQPHFIRLEQMTTEYPTPAAVNWRLLESMSLLADLTGEDPTSVSADAITAPMRNASEFVALEVSLRRINAFVHVSMNEAVERRDMTLAATDRKAYVDELNETVPVRLIEERGASANARWVSCPPPSPEELARQQCLAFLEATIHSDKAEDERLIWQSAFSIVEAAEASLMAGGATSPVVPRRADESGSRGLRLVARIAQRSGHNRPLPA